MRKCNTGPRKVVCLSFSFFLFLKRALHEKFNHSESVFSSTKEIILRGPQDMIKSAVIILKPLIFLI